MTRSGLHPTLLPALVFTVFSVFAVPAWAHDVWIEPATFSPTVDHPIEVHLRVGEAFRGETVARNPRRIRRLVAVGPSGSERPLPGLDGARPAGFLRPAEAGPVMLLYESTRARLELPAATFERHLVREGLERVSEARRERGEVGEPGRELYSRCAKALVVVSGAGDEAPAPPGRLGCRLELVLESRLDRLAVGREVAIRLFFDGRPLAGARVDALTKSSADVVASWRTPVDGGLRIPLDRSGAWLIRVVHMKPAQPDTDADWESWWASLAFEVGPVPLGEESRPLHPAREASWRSSTWPAPDSPSGSGSGRRGSPRSAPPGPASTCTSNRSPHSPSPCRSSASRSGRSWPSAADRGLRCQRVQVPQLRLVPGVPDGRVDAVSLVEQPLDQPARDVAGRSRDQDGRFRVDDRHPPLTGRSVPQGRPRPAARAPLAAKTPTPRRLIR